MTNFDQELSNFTDVNDSNFVAEMDPETDRNRRLRLWEECYQTRDNAARKFKKFLSSDRDSICRISGHIGSGKTTFVLGQLENPASKCYNECNGIWINLGKIATDLRQIDSRVKKEYRAKTRIKDQNKAEERRLLGDAVGEYLDKKIVKEVELRFRRHMWWIHKSPILKNHLRLDFYHKLHIHCIEETPAERRWYGDEIHRLTNAAICVERPDEDACSYRIQAQKRIKDIPTTKEQEFDQLRDIADWFGENRDGKYLHFKKTLNSEVPSANRTCWLARYTRFFPAKHIIIVLDDVDRVNDKDLHDATVNYARTLGRELKSNVAHGSPDETEEKLPRDIKVVYCIRDWNMSSSEESETHGPAYVDERPIILGEVGAGFASPQDREKETTYVNFDEKFSLGVILKRLEMTRKVFEQKTEGIKRDIKELERIISKARAENGNNTDRLAQSNPALNQSVDLAVNGKSDVKSLEDQLKAKKADSQLIRRNTVLLDCFSNTIEQLWRKGSQIWRIDILDITNASVRNLLGMSREIVYEIMRKFEGNQSAIDMYMDHVDSSGLRPFVIDWVFNKTPSPNEQENITLKKHIRDAKELVLNQDVKNRKHMCCTHRLILTYLDNICTKSTSGERKIQIVEVYKLIEDLQKYTNCDPQDVKDVLYFLFSEYDREAEYITILQNKEINEVKNIQEDALIYINPRGRALVKNVMVKFEYWCRLVEGFESPHEKMSRLFETTPKNALANLKRVYSVVERLSRAHIKNWMYLVCVHWKALALAPNSNPFDRFTSERFSYGHFYLRRVSQSHKGTIIFYVMSLMRQIGVLTIPQREQMEFDKHWPELNDKEASRLKKARKECSGRSGDEQRQQLETPTIEFIGDLIEKYKKQLGKKEQFIMSGIMDILKKYDDISSKLDKLRNMNYRDLCREYEQLKSSEKAE